MTTQLSSSFLLHLLIFPRFLQKTDEKTLQRTFCTNLFSILREMFSRMHLKWYCFLEKSVHLNFEVLLKNWKKLRVDKLENVMKKLSILKKKTRSSFQKALLTKLECANYPGGSRVSCLILTPLHCSVNLVNYISHILEISFFCTY